LAEKTRHITITCGTNFHFAEWITWQMDRRKPFK
jgi:hypothetical protein